MGVALALGDTVEEARAEPELCRPGHIVLSRLTVWLLATPTIQITIERHPVPNIESHQ